MRYERMSAIVMEWIYNENYLKIKTESSGN